MKLVTNSTAEVTPEFAQETRVDAFLTVRYQKVSIVTKLIRVLTAFAEETAIYLPDTKNARVDLSGTLKS